MPFKPIDDRLPPFNSYSPIHKPLPPPPPQDHTPLHPLAPLMLSDVISRPLCWLWPGRIPLGHLTLMDATPGSGLSLLALTLAACISSGSPLPDGTPTHKGGVLLLTPYDCPADTIRPRFEAAGGDPTHVVLLRPRLKELPTKREAPPPSSPPRFLRFPQDLNLLETYIHFVRARLVIIDPASAISGLTRCLPALIEMAQQNNCAILLTRSLRQPPADPLHSPAPQSALHEAARSRLLLTPDPADERRHLLLTTRHPLCTQPPILAYDIRSSQAEIPTIHWLGQHDRSQLTRLCTGPLRSPHRQAILRFLQESHSPQSIPDILNVTSYDYDPGRKMLTRMREAGELVCTARGLYTIPTHPCLLQPTEPTPAPSVPNVPTVPDTVSARRSLTNASNAPVPNVPTVPDTVSPPVPDNASTPVPSVPTVPETPSTPVPDTPSASVSRLPESASTSVTTVPSVSTGLQTLDVRQAPITSNGTELGEPHSGEESA